jgi:Ran GTPase-activating protein (RanGAP) involved in mRNA processing and transport
MAGPIQQLSRISTITTLKLDFALHADGWSALNDDTQGWLALSELLFSNTGLKKLDFSNQRIWSQHLYHIAYALGLTTTRTTLEVLDLTGNQACPRSFSFPEYMGKIGDAVADIISIKSRLSTLLAAWQSIDDEDAMAIAKALKNNTSLMTLVLADNKVGATGSAAIFDAIAKNRKSALTDLDLSGCKIDFSAAKRFAKLLEKNTSLANIAIGTVPDAESLAIVREGLSNNQTVVKLKFGCMPNPDEPFQKIRLQIDADLKRRKIAAACKSYTSTGTTSSTGNTGSPTNTSSTNTVSPVTYYKWD